MLNNKSRPPVIGKLIIGTSYRTGVVTSPRSPLDMKILSPETLKNYDAGGIGLGILAALENSGETEKGRSDPIPVGSTKDSGRIKGGLEEINKGSLEDYTYVTCHRSQNKSFTRVYCDAGAGAGAGAGESGRRGHRRGGFQGPCVFDISPARLRDTPAPAPAPAYPTSDFLSSCNLCHKKLDGKDIYMYRGEKAFCSTECRCMQIAMDERSSSSASRSVDVSNSPYANDQIFFSTGILAT